MIGVWHPPEESGRAIAVRLIWRDGKLGGIVVVRGGPDQSPVSLEEAGDLLSRAGVGKAAELLADPSTTVVRAARSLVALRA